MDSWAVCWWRLSVPWRLAMAILIYLVSWSCPWPWFTWLLFPPHPWFSVRSGQGWGRHADLTPASGPGQRAPPPKWPPARECPVQSAEGDTCGLVTSPELAMPSNHCCFHLVRTRAGWLLGRAVIDWRRGHPPTRRPGQTKNTIHHNESAFMNRIVTGSGMQVSNCT